VSDNPAELLQTFVSALQRKDRAGANEAAFALIDMRAPLGEKWRLIARVMQTNGETQAANRAMELLVRHDAANPRLLFEQAALAARTGRLAKARSIMAGVPDHIPDPSSHAFILGSIALNMSDLDEADAQLLRAVQANPQSGQAMYALAQVRRRPLGDVAGDAILAAKHAIAAAPLLERAQAHYAASKVLADRKQHDEAFAELERGAALAKAERPYDRAADLRDAQAATEGFDADLIGRINARIEIPTDDAIFVTGLPRSGTTLVEQIIASHSRVGAGEELGSMAVVRREPGARSAAQLDAHDDPQSLSSLYLHLARQRFGEGHRFVDKSLGSPRHIGWIAALLPQAPIVWMRRDPRDCAWSALRTWFTLGQDWSWDQRDIAAHFMAEDALYQTWSQMLPDRILTVDYAQLVTDPKAQIARLLDHCGLTHEDQCFAPHETRRAVTTASTAQVRQPINMQGVGAAQPYAEHLHPFATAYRAP
jgi:tetratricopeptide (TPR) repeat protein